ncbi:MAG TPA: hypothetical protein VNK46_14230 [Nitrospiraceae bacterium]|nr:hypothetical protein [Nitrospiraceae bacterium]
MPTTWGTVETVGNHPDGSGEIVIRTRPSRHADLRVHASVSPRTLIARGVRRIALADIRAGEFVELTYHHNLHGMEVELIYVRSDPGGFSKAHSA